MAGTKHLNGMADTGKRIMKDFSNFSYSLTSLNNGSVTPITQFGKYVVVGNWKYFGQVGYFRIEFSGTISQNVIDVLSVIDTSSHSKYKFGRPLSPNNDSSLSIAFQHILQDARNKNIL